MENQDSFWRDASRKIDYLLKNPIKLNNSDLLQDNLEDAKVSLHQDNEKPHYKSKISAFNIKYTNYKPLFVSILKKSQRYITSKTRTERSPSPALHQPNAYNLDGSFLTQNSNNLEIYGQRAGFTFLPKLSCPSKIKTFLVKVKEKYQNLFGQLKDEDGLIRSEGVMDYLSVRCSMRKFVPKVKLLNSSGLRSESTMRRPRHAFNEKDHLNHIQDQARAVLVRFYIGIIGSF